RMVLEAIYDSPHGSYFKAESHGFRCAKSCHSALKDIQARWSGVTWFIEGDIKACFDDIDHEILIDILRKKIKDERFLSIVRSFLKAGYQDLDGTRKESLAGTPQGGIVSPILANIYLHELDEYVEQLQKELEKGELRRPNPAYRKLQKRRQYLAKTGKIDTREYRDLGVQMRKLPSLDPQDPNFVRVKFVRYADDWLIGVTGPHQLAEDIKERVGQFLKSRLSLTLSAEKTRITHARTEEAEFLGYRIRLGRSDKEPKQTLSTNASGKNFKRRSTGMQIVLKAPMEKLIQRLHQKGFCDKKGRPLHKAAWMQQDEDQIIAQYSAVNRGLQQYYRPTDNWNEMSRVQYILKFSLAKTLAAKRQRPMTQVIRGKDISIKVKRARGQERTVTFYRNTDWSVRRGAFTDSPEVDLVRMHIRLRTRSKLGWPCVVCGETQGIAMHHVRHVRKGLTSRGSKGFTRVMAILNRKQVPVCTSCHNKIHRGEYDGLSPKDLMYDPRKPLPGGHGT
ncbi:MAG TPA: reverse transcriptase domain-containing protein, partial [Ktedonobacteraceae bacterium]|nr:reverse transcriptase domain-containing protein [Ktedonobacteraceae bacterium]